MRDTKLLRKESNIKGRMSDGMWDGARENMEKITL